MGNSARLAEWTESAERTREEGRRAKESVQRRIRLLENPKLPQSVREEAAQAGAEEDGG
jgi:hypothetical protein